MDAREEIYILLTAGALLMLTQILSYLIIGIAQRSADEANREGGRARRQGIGTLRGSTATTCGSLLAYARKVSQGAPNRRRGGRQ
jgi:hypothetical protein